MSLRPKTIRYDRVYASFEEGLVSLYSGTGLAHKSGLAMFQDVYDMCTAHPKPFTEQLFGDIADFLVSMVDQVLQVGNSVETSALRGSNGGLASKAHDIPRRLGICLCPRMGPLPASFPGSQLHLRVP